MCVYTLCLIFARHVVRRKFPRDKQICANDIAVSTPVKENNDSTADEVGNIENDIPDRA